MDFTTKGIPRASYLSPSQYEELKKQKTFLEDRIYGLPQRQRKRWEIKLKLIKQRIQAYDSLHKGFEI